MVSELYASGDWNDRKALALEVMLAAGDAGLKEYMLSKLRGRSRLEPLYYASKYLSRFGSTVELEKTVARLPVATEKDLKLNGFQRLNAEAAMKVLRLRDAFKSK